MQEFLFGEHRPSADLIAGGPTHTLNVLVLSITYRAQSEGLLRIALHRCCNSVQLTFTRVYNRETGHTVLDAIYAVPLNEVSLNVIDPRTKHP
jgi:hypothetical protein